MARITVEDCLVRENNRFALVQLASKRTKQILLGAKVLLKETRNKAVVTALREIATGQVRFLSAEEKAQQEAEAEKIRAEQAAAAAAVAPEVVAPPVVSDSSSSGENGSHAA